MKTLLPFLLVFLFPNFAQAQYAIPDYMYFDVIDTDGNTHTLNDYFDQGKSVFVFEFSNAGFSYLEHQNLNLEDLYNTYGQGGSNEIAVLYLAGLDFDSASDLENIDYSAELGVGYENVSFFENNPIPIAVLAENPDTDWLSEKYEMRILCTDEKYTDFSSSVPDAYMARMYNLCCVANEVYEPGLRSLTSVNQVDCEPQEVNYQLINGAPIPIDACNIDVLIDGVFEETIVFIGPLEGCGSTDLIYTNTSLQGNEVLTMAVADVNELTSNDTIYIHTTEVDTVRGQFKMELQNPLDDYGYGGFSVGQSSFAWIDQSTNWYNQVFVDETGCMQLSYTGGKFSVGPSQSMLIVSLNEDESIQDTLVYIEGDLINIQGTRDVYIESIPTPYLWGYVFEDPNETQLFAPYLAGISGIEVSQGANSTFSNTAGYYQLPISPSDPIQMVYDQSVWPVITTPSSANYNPNTNIYNFGLNQNDPAWTSASWFSNGLPMFCETPLHQQISISNTGNQPIYQTIVFTHDPQLVVDLDEIYPNPTSVNGNQLTFDLEIIPFGYNGWISITYTPASASLLGSFITTEFTISTSDVDGNLISTENESYTDSLFCAYDPNDIYGFPLGEGPAGLISANTDLDYRIRFQNTGNAPASQVVVSHTVPLELNWESIVPGPTSHDSHIEMNSETREMTWVFNGINLPDSASDPTGSIGHIWYKAAMNALVPGDEIENVAAIYFDQNEAVITNTSLHTISNVVSVSNPQIEEIKGYPNPVIDVVQFDLGNFKSISSYTIYDKLGRTVMGKSVSSGLVSIEMTKLEAGAYTVVFRTKAHTPIARTRIVKVD